MSVTIFTMTTNLTTPGSFHSMGWAIDARWYYAPLAFFFGILAIRDSYSIEPMNYWLLIALLLVAYLVNLVFYFSFREIHTNTIPDTRMALLHTAQIAFDIAYFFIIAVISDKGVNGVIYAFFFIPIIVSTVVFGHRSPIYVALISSLCALISIILQYGIPFSGFVSTSPPQEPFSHAVQYVFILSLLYLLTGFLGTYISRIIRARDTLLMQKITQEEQHIRRLEALTKEFEQSAKLLVRRDLELSAANDKLQKLDQLKSEIISVAAHQLRTPLSAIKWTLKMLLDEDVGKISDEQKGLLTKGYESNERMITLVNDMLSVDRLESGKIKYNFVPVQYESLVESLIQEVLPLAAKKNIRIELRRPEELLPKVKLDPDKIHDVLQNLIDNAIKYSKPDSIIRVTIEATKNDVITRVADSGIGIPKDQQDKIFTRFFRAANAIKNETEGSGLGLFIAQSVVRRHGGEILFSSEEGVGSTFSFTLPFSS